MTSTPAGLMTGNWLPGIGLAADVTALGAAAGVCARAGLYVARVANTTSARPTAERVAGQSRLQEWEVFMAWIPLIG